jgi:hypothetical protein
MYGTVYRRSDAPADFWNPTDTRCRSRRSRSTRSGSSGCWPRAGRWPTSRQRGVRPTGRCAGRMAVVGTGRRRGALRPRRGRALGGAPQPPPHRLPRVVAQVGEDCRRHPGPEVADTRSIALTPRSRSGQRDRQAEIDAGRRPGTTTDESAELKRNRSVRPPSSTPAASPHLLVRAPATQLSAADLLLRHQREPA